MKHNSWSDCLNSNTAKIVSPDILRSKSLFETAQERIAIITDIHSKNCNFVFEDYYTSILEMIQAIAFLEGFNILNHLCTKFYLEEHLQEAYLAALFEDLRYKRNNLTYYGNKMDFETAQETIANAKKIMQNLIIIYQKMSI
ncbi:MAG: hypothetical protein ACMXYK_05475 [Candidatus Woesearchaeota archaeon]